MDKHDEVKVVTALRSGEEIDKSAPLITNKSKETLVEEEKVETKSLELDDIEQCPIPPPFPEALKLPRKLDTTFKISVVIQHKTPPKYKDPGCPTISCTIGDYIMEFALLDLRASVNLIPFSIYQKLGLGELKPTLVTLQLAEPLCKGAEGDG